MEMISLRTKGRNTSLAAALLLSGLAVCLPAQVRAQWATSGNNISNTNSGNVGVGTASPQTQLDVAGTATAVRSTFGGTAGSHGKFQIFSRDIPNNPFGEMQLYAPGGAGTEYLRFNIGNSSGTVHPDVLTISRTGNVGVGTASPSSLFHLSGATRPALAISDSSGFKARVVKTLGLQSDFSHNVSYDGTGWLLDDTSRGGSSISLGSNFIGINLWTAGPGYRPTSTPLFISPSGRVGVGTLSPASPLTVGSDANVTPLLVTGNNTNVVGLAVSNTQAGSKAWAFQVAGPNHLESVPNGSLILRQATDNINPLVISKAGDVGVGTAAPATKLHVVGDITVTGNINAKYQDVAEWVPSTQKLSAGTVVVLDTTRDNHVLASKGAYDTRVAGVISAQPGLSLGEAGENKVLVATTGRVKVKVDATRAPIRIGDLLVTSEVEGLAMKSEPVSVGGGAFHRPGTLIGKALESLEKGTGEILVLLGLQ
jgi:hypothetical protein